MPRSAILSESQSRNTRGNAEASRALVEPLGIDRVLLVTSAWHLRRAVPLFERVGFEVIPVGADYRALGTCSGPACWLPSFDALGLTSMAWKDIWGIGGAVIWVGGVGRCGRGRCGPVLAGSEASEADSSPIAMTVVRPRFPACPGRCSGDFSRPWVAATSVAQG
ncbi:MAG: YdcF family protein [Thiocapsa sp.]|nr:MAG: YdcF family protein [Thiocapsa sp.]